MLDIDGSEPIEVDAQSLGSTAFPSNLPPLRRSSTLDDFAQKAMAATSNSYPRDTRHFNAWNPSAVTSKHRVPLVVDMSFVLIGPPPGKAIVKQAKTNLAQKEKEALAEEKMRLSREIEERRRENEAALKLEAELRDHCSRAHEAYTSMVEQVTPVLNRPPTFIPFSHSIRACVYSSPPTHKLDCAQLNGAAIREGDSILFTPLPQFDNSVLQTQEPMFFNPLPGVGEEDEDEDDEDDKDDKSSTESDPEPSEKQSYRVPGQVPPGKNVRRARSYSNPSTSPSRTQWSTRSASRSPSPPVRAAAPTHFGAVYSPLSQDSHGYQATPHPSVNADSDVLRSRLHRILTDPSSSTPPKSGQLSASMVQDRAMAGPLLMVALRQAVCPTAVPDTTSSAKEWVTTIGTRRGPGTRPRFRFAGASIMTLLFFPLFQHGVAK
ncbi:hypothetical protein NMY22_g14458 [Coprinellus aureogranulatus]|nr:hypothetical protein NMY22_g14458 [Coprinellus aureogranulatus]